LPSHLNDDKLGRELDEFYRVGITKLFTAIAIKSVHKFQVKKEIIHLDGTSMYVHGEYEKKEAINGSCVTFMVKIKTATI